MIEEPKVKTTIGELVGYFDGFYLIDKGEEGTWLTEEEYETVKLPELNKYEREYYDKIKQLKNGNKRGMVSFMSFDAMAPDWTFSYESYYKILEAIFKGGCNN